MAHLNEGWSPAAPVLFGLFLGRRPRFPDPLHVMPGIPRLVRVRVPDNSGLEQRALTFVLGGPGRHKDPGIESRGLGGAMPPLSGQAALGEEVGLGRDGRGIQGKNLGDIG